MMLLFAGEITRSMSSIGTAPRRTSSPITIAPVKQLLFSKLTSIGPTYGHKCLSPQAVVTSLFCNSSNPNWRAMCCGMQRCRAPVSTRAFALYVFFVSLGFFRLRLAWTSPIF